MAVVVGEAAVKLRPETSTFANEAERDIDDKLPGVARKAAGFFAAAFAAVGIGAFLGKAITEATDLGESMSKVNVVFGDSAGVIADFASTASTALGQSETQALAAAGTFGSLFVGMGLGQQQAADMSTTMVTLASDMASFGNATPEEALDALRSGLIGEAEPLRRFGVMLDAAKIEAEALRLGLVGEGEALTEAAKAQAVYSLALTQTAIQQGDFQRTSAGLANQQRIMRAQFTDLATDVGGLLVPALGDAAAGITGGLMPALLGATDALPELGIRFADSIAGTREQLGELTGAFQEAFVDGAAGSALLGEASLAGLAVTLGHVTSQARDALGPAFLAIGDALGPALDQVSDAFGEAFGGAGGGGGVLGIVVGAIEVIGPIIADYIARWLPVIEAIIPIIADVFSALAPIIADLVGQIGPLLTSLMPVISQVAAVFATGLLAVLQALAPIIPDLVAALGQIAQTIAGALLSVLQALAPILPELLVSFAQIAAVLAGVLASALSAILPILPTLVDVFVMLIVSALLPLLPMLPMLAQLFAQIITALAPLIPPLLQLVMVIIQLVVAAIVPLLPLLPALIGLFSTLLGALMPIIGVLLSIAGAFIGFASAVASVVLGLISTVIGAWTGFYVGLTGIVSRIAGGVLGGFRGLRDGVVGIFSGISDTVGSLFQGIGGAIRSAINGIIAGINGSVIAGINVVIRGANAVNPFDDIPTVPRIPSFHSGGIFDSGHGEGLALLRDQELIATPEQRRVANDLLGSLLAGAGAPAAAAAAAGAGVTVEQTIIQQPGESGASLAARVTQGVVWNLNAGITRPVGAGADL